MTGITTKLQLHLRDLRVNNIPTKFRWLFDTAFVTGILFLPDSLMTLGNWQSSLRSWGFPQFKSSV
jgi:hypothetical protein